MYPNINRRVFIKRLQAVLMTLSSVSILQAIDHTRDNDCPGGGDNYDICNSETRNPDSCPGELPPIDKCDNGGRAEDYCETGRVNADTCSPNVENSDQCPTGMSPDDTCAENKIDPDICYNGTSPKPDTCPPSGGLKDGDNCPGGSMAVDNCGSDGQGEECSIEKGYGYAYGEDRCNEAIEDGCVVTPDVCNNGTNTLLGTGDDDICGRGLYVGPKGSDTCHDGSENQDKCGTIEGDPDLCIVTAYSDNGDFCNPSASYPSDDVCFNGLPTSDECSPPLNDQDECPEGAAPADECPSSLVEDDICLPGNDITDHCDYGTPQSDECSGMHDSCNSGISDLVE